MRNLTLQTTLIALTIFMASAGASRAEEDHSWWWYQKAKVACIGDVMRLCRSFVPDEDKVRGCMATKRTQVSGGCAEFYPGGKNAD